MDSARHKIQFSKLDELGLVPNANQNGYSMDSLKEANLKTYCKNNNNSNKNAGIAGK